MGTPDPVFGNVCPERGAAAAVRAAGTSRACRAGAGCWAAGSVLDKVQALVAGGAPDAGEAL